MSTHFDTHTIKAADKNRGNASLIFDEAASKWRAEAGRHESLSSYSGTLRPVSTARQQHFLDEEACVDLYWETAPIYPIAAAKSTKTVRVKIAVTAAELTQLRASKFNPYYLTQIARKQHGPTVSEAVILVAPALRAPVAKTTDGKTVTTYQIISNHRVISVASTLSEARATAVRLMKEDTAGLITVLDVRAVITRDTGSDTLLSISRPTVDATLTVSATFEIPDETKVLSYVVPLRIHS